MSLNEKYIYQDTPLNALSKKELEDEDEERQHFLAVK